MIVWLQKFIREALYNPIDIVVATLGTLQKYLLRGLLSISAVCMYNVLPSYLLYNTMFWSEKKSLVPNFVCKSSLLNITGENTNLMLISNRIFTAILHYCNASCVNFEGQSSLQICLLVQ